MELQNQLTIDDLWDGIIVHKKEYHFAKNKNNLLLTHLSSKKTHEILLPNHRQFSIVYIDQEYGHVFATIDNKLLVITNENDSFEYHKYELMSDKVIESCGDTVSAQNMITLVEVRKEKDRSNKQFLDYSIQYSIQGKNGQQGASDIDKSLRYQVRLYIDFASTKHNEINSNQSTQTKQAVEQVDDERSNSDHQGALGVVEDSSVKDMCIPACSFCNNDELTYLLTLTEGSKVYYCCMCFQENTIKPGSENSISEYTLNERKSVYIKDRQKIKLDFNKYHALARAMPIRSCGICSSKMHVCPSGSISKAGKNYATFLCKKCVSDFRGMPFWKNQCVQLLTLNQHEKWYPILEECKSRKLKWNEFHALARKLGVPRCKKCKDNTYVFAHSIERSTRGDYYKYLCYVCDTSVCIRPLSNSQVVHLYHFLDVENWENRLKELQIAENSDSSSEDEPDGLQNIELEKNQPDTTTNNNQLNIPVDDVLKGTTPREVDSLECLDNISDIDCEDIDLGLQNLFDSDSACKKDKPLPDNGGCALKGNALIGEENSKSNEVELEFFEKELNLEGLNSVTGNKRPEDTQEAEKLQSRTVQSADFVQEKEISTVPLSSNPVEENFVSPITSAQPYVPGIGVNDQRNEIHLNIEISDSTMGNVEVTSTIDHLKSPVAQIADVTQEKETNSMPLSPHRGEESPASPITSAQPLVSGTGVSDDSDNATMSIEESEQSKNSEAVTLSLEANSESKKRRTPETDSTQGRQKKQRSRVDKPQSKRTIQCLFQCKNRKLVPLRERILRRDVTYTEYYCNQCVSICLIPASSDIPLKFSRERDPLNRKMLKEEWNFYYELERKHKLPCCSDSECRNSNLHVFPIGKNKKHYLFHCKNCNFTLVDESFEEFIEVIPFGLISEWQRRLEKQWPTELKAFRKNRDRTLQGLQVISSDQSNQVINSHQPKIKRTIECLYQCNNKNLTSLHKTTIRSKPHTRHYCNQCFSTCAIPVDANAPIKFNSERDPGKRKRLKEEWNFYYELVRKHKLPCCTGPKCSNSNLHVFTKGTQNKRYRFFCKNCKYQFKGDSFDKSINVIPFRLIDKWQKKLKEQWPNELKEFREKREKVSEELQTISSDSSIQIDEQINSYESDIDSDNSIEIVRSNNDRLASSSRKRGAPEVNSNQRKQKKQKNTKTNNNLDEVVVTKVPANMQQYRSRKLEWNKYHKYAREFSVPCCLKCEENTYVFSKGTRQLKSGLFYRYYCNLCKKSVNTKPLNKNEIVKLISFNSTKKWKAKLKEYQEKEKNK